MLRNLACPVPAQQTDLTRLWRGARFSRTDRAMQSRVPIHTLANNCLLPLLLNPGDPKQQVQQQILRTEQTDPDSAPYDLNPLLDAIPITHPYHTRVMVETLAREVVGTVRGLDIRRLLDALLKRAVALPRDMSRELSRLRDFLRTYTPRFELFSAWSYRLFACLVLMMTLANAIAPDNAFAKGSFGGHGSFSGHGSFGGHSGFGGHGSFSAHGGEMGGRVSTSSFGESFGGGSGGRTTSSSFGPGGASGRTSGSFGHNGGFGNESIARSVSTPRITGTGFRSSYGRTTVDIYGVPEPTRYYEYCGSGFGHYHGYTAVNGGTRSTTPPEKHPSLFVAADDLIVLENGDVVVTLSDTAYLLLTNGTVALMNNSSPDPLLLLYPDPILFQNVAAQISRQQAGVQRAVQVRRDWLSWVGWSAVLFPTVAGDRTERDNLENLSHRLDTALQRLGDAPQNTKGATPGPDQIEMFIGCMLLPDGTVSLHGADGFWISTDGNQIASTGGATKSGPCPPLLASTLRSILLKMQQDRTGGIASDQNDLSQLGYDRSSLQNDMSQYQSLEEINGPSYDVDYGTDEISASDAISRTQFDLDQNARDQLQVEADMARLQTEQTKIHSALQQFPTGK